MSLPSMYIQTIAVLNPNSQPPEVMEPNVLYLERPGYYSYTHLPSNTTPLLDVILRTESVTLKEAISSVPVVWQSELLHEYQELGHALVEMNELDDEDEWKIEATVYEAARRVAFALMVHSYPAPHVLHHGPKSVVFNWTSNSNNLYLTISSDRMSALISSPERIKRRIEFPMPALETPMAAIRCIQADYLGQPVISTVNPSSDLAASTR